MDTSPKYCESCGSQLPEGVDFCVQCGAPVPEPVSPAINAPTQSQEYQSTAVEQTNEQAAPAAQSEPPYSPPIGPSSNYTAPPPLPPTPRPASKSRFPCLIIVGVVLLLMICLGILAIAAFFYFYPLSSSGSTVEIQEVVESSGAYANANTIFDTFDDNSLGWETDTASDLTSLVENGAYSIYTNAPATYFWIYPPVDFDPTVIEFDAWVDPDSSTQGFGTYGVVCNLQDSNNFTYVEIDPVDGSYYFSKFVDDEEISLRDESWTESANFNPGVGIVNHIRVECYPNSISLFINGSFENKVEIDPPAVPGKSGLLIGTWDTIDPNGYKVYFDNFYGTVTQQQP